MITCDRCQTENLEGSQYCDECGAALVAGASSSPQHGKFSTSAGGVSSAPAAGIVERRVPAGGDSTAKPDSGNGHRIEATAAAPEPVAHFATQSSPDVLSREQDGPHAKLVIHRGRSAGKEFLLDEDESQIGRWDADGGIFPDVDLDADDPEAKVSRRHARITRRGEQYFVEDLGSTNGTFINRGRRLLPGDRQTLRDGDEVIVGKTFLRFQILK